MSNSYFKFKQFTVFQDKCAMKVGTDGVLLGAWAEVENARRVLDIGTGTGLIALMAAQRSRAEMTGIDVDECAVRQAVENVEHSPWKGRIEIERLDARNLPDLWIGAFDAVVSNPPYFAEELKSPSPSRNRARHTDGLNFASLLHGVEKVLSSDGVFSMILPAGSASGFIALALGGNLHLSRQTWVHTKPDMPPKRVLMAFVRDIPSRTDIRHLTVEIRPGEYSAEYADLLRPFYPAL